MLPNSLSALPSPSHPTATLELSGRPPDIPSTATGGKIDVAISSNPGSLNFKAALAGTSQETLRKAPQWTFVGEGDIETGLFQGEPELRLSGKFKEKLCQPWKKTLIVRLLGRSITYSYLCSQLRWKWRPVGSLEILDLNNDTFLATFGDDQDYLRALTGGPWVILDHYLVVHQWSPSFRTSDKPHKSVVAWVQFPELPVHYYHREVLFAIGNLVGRTVKLDYHTENLERGKFARIVIDLDMTKPLPTRVRLDGVWQQVLYENIPTICYECGRIGHTERDCPTKRPPLLLAPATQGEQTVSSSAAETSETPAGYGPWMQVVRKTRRQNGKPTATSASNPGTNKGKKQELPKDSNPVKGKSNVEQSITVGEIKGKHEQQKGAKHSKQGNQKGKEVDSKQSGDVKATTTSRVWRPVGLNTKEASSSKGPMESSPEEAQPPTQQPALQPQVIAGPNKTKIQILNVPDLQFQQKENRDPNQRDSSVRHHYKRKTADQAPHPKGVNLKATKKTLQIRSPGKKERQLKQTPTSLPISLQAIEEFCVIAQKKSEHTSCLPTKIAEDEAMVESAEVEAANTPPRDKDPEATAPITIEQPRSI
ncbi:unnamed protein product [Linum trigynum]|uniref:CCHC-type domain-containing protein n=1 Tax=Linum trigynum TaxID=586398 RepID=A0AAV2EE77_9ROSI